MNLPPRFARQSLAGYMRQHLNLIDQAIDAGVSYAALGELLGTAGFGTVDPSALSSAIYRARLGRGRRGALARAREGAGQ